MIPKKHVGAFFIIKNQFILRSCHINDVEVYGDFRIYPRSHDEIWQGEFAKKYYDTLEEPLEN